MSIGRSLAKAISQTTQARALWADGDIAAAFELVTDSLVWLRNAEALLSFEFHNRTRESAKQEPGASS